jgi:glutathione S-transferase
VSTKPPAVLHRCPAPTNWLCPCGRVERELRRHGVEHETERHALRAKHRDEIAQLSGQRKLPVLELEGEAIADSKRIVEHLEHRDANQGPGSD